MSKVEFLRLWFDDARIDIDEADRLVVEIFGRTFAVSLSAFYEVSGHTTDEAADEDD